MNNLRVIIKREERKEGINEGRKKKRKEKKEVIHDSQIQRKEKGNRKTSVIPDCNQEREKKGPNEGKLNKTHKIR